MKIQKLGVNYCHCPCCHTEFFFNADDIHTENYLNMPAVSCPYCSQCITIGMHKKNFIYVKTDDEEYQ